jgi:micrococcal nuclease
MKQAALICGALIFSIAAYSAWKSPDEQQGYCIAIDGDTLRCEGNLRLRLNGIDAPELSEYGGYNSKQRLSFLIRGAKLRWIPLKKDRYGRTVAQVYLNNIDLSCFQLTAGRARYIKEWDEYGMTARCLRH